MARLPEYRDSLYGDTQTDPALRRRVEWSARRRAEGAREQEVRDQNEAATQGGLWQVSATAALANFVRAKSYRAATAGFKTDYDALEANPTSSTLLQSLRFADKDEVERALAGRPDADKFRRALIYDQVHLQDATSTPMLAAIKTQEDAARASLIRNIKMVRKDGKPLTDDQATAIATRMSEEIDKYLQAHPGATYDQALKGAFDVASQVGISANLREFNAAILENEQVKRERERFNNLLDHLGMVKSGPAVFIGGFLGPITQDVSLAQLEGHGARFLTDATRVDRDRLNPDTLRLGKSGRQSTIDEQGAILDSLTECIHLDKDFASIIDNSTVRKGINVGISGAACAITGVSTEISAAWEAFFKDKPVDEKTYASFMEKYGEKFKDFFAGAGRSLTTVKDKVVMRVNVAERGRHAMEQWFLMADPENAQYGNTNLTQQTIDRLTTIKGHDGRSVLDRLQELALEQTPGRNFTEKPLTYREIAILGLDRDQVSTRATQYTGTNSKTPAQEHQLMYSAALHPRSLFGMQATGTVDIDIPAHMQARYMVKDRLIAAAAPEPAGRPRGRASLGGTAEVAAVTFPEGVRGGDEVATAETDPLRALALRLAAAARGESIPGNLG